jgi:hypothetical protein
MGERVAFRLLDNRHLRSVSLRAAHHPTAEAQMIERRHAQGSVTDPAAATVLKATLASPTRYGTQTCTRGGVEEHKGSGASYDLPHAYQAQLCQD